jgi:hypothetical protein
VGTPIVFTVGTLVGLRVGRYRGNGADLAAAVFV